MSMNWKRRVSYDPSLGYYADGIEHRYVVYRYESSWLLQVRRLGADGSTSSHPVDTDRNDTLTMCKAVAEAYETEPVLDRVRHLNRMTRAISRAYAR